LSFALVSIVFLLSYLRIPPPQEKISFLEVKLGDAILYQTPQNYRILIDTGKDASILGALDRQIHPLYKRINLLILTHSDIDHIGGLEYLVRHYQVDEIWLSPMAQKSLEYQELIKRTPLIKKIPQQTIWAPAAWKISPQTYLELIYPIDTTRADSNDQSLVLRLHSLDNAILLTGDLEAKGEFELMRTGALLKSNLLKIAHHGSATSSTLPFLKQVKPQFGIIQASSGNPFGHPHEEVLKSLSDLKINTMITRQYGDISFCLEKKWSICR